ncbi:ComGF family competence protein [Lactobacillus sp. ESL0791]|uniref:ComGF family competence protein n=1 Tax=Lactobacillus sp. ESL0791 TaxID=2983234 RepID=UPI0023F6F955|nr:ComGF family competence protein [Lactobacillus sp. ESL0791]MDF7638691.1 ComGF family competence protein [Lactobacillus sp. ESL0791]
MIQKKNKRTKLTSKGFLLAEAVFSVFVTMIVVLLLQGLLKTLSTANQKVNYTDDLVFSYVQFNRFLHDGKTQTVYTLPSASKFNKAVFVKLKKDGEKVEEKQYSLSVYKSMIRATGENGGHMPLLLNVQMATFVTKDELIKINVTENNGRRSVLYFKLDPRPTRKQDEKNKEKIIHESKGNGQRFIK